MRNSQNTRSAGGSSAVIHALWLLTLLALAGCTAVPVHSFDSAARSSSGPLAESRASYMLTASPGLGTKWGESRNSSVRGTDFVRASGTPAGTCSIYYNNSAGSPGNDWRRSQPFPIGNGTASIGIKSKSGFGGYLRAYNAGGQNHVIGSEGQRYAIEIKNHTNTRIEVVLSVDGLDVIDGKGATHGKRGYLVGPHDRIEISGFRKSYSEVAAFRFSGIEASYAARRHGDTRNVGVIGAAVFTEKGADRHGANPFPGEITGNRFATPPGY